jgi:hypothetical protein
VLPAHLPAGVVTGARLTRGQSETTRSEKLPSPRSTTSIRILHGAGGRVELSPRSSASPPTFRPGRTLAGVVQLTSRLFSQGRKRRGRLSLLPDELATAGATGTHKCGGLISRLPRRRLIPGGATADVRLVAAVGVHDVDLEVAVAPAREDDPAPVRRPCRVEISSRVLSVSWRRPVPSELMT